MSKRKDIIADFSLILVALFWGGGFVVLKDTLNKITPMYIMSIRFGLAFLIMSLIFIKKLKNVRKRDFGAGFIIGIFLFGGFATQTIGLQYTTVSKQAFLTGTNVVIVPFITWFVYKKRPDVYSLVGTALSLVGIALLTLDNSLIINVGDLLTLICAVFFAAHISSVGYFAEHSDPIILTIIQFGVAAILFMLCAIIFESPPLSFNNNMIFSVGYLVLFPTLLAFLIQNLAQKYTSSTHAAIILCLESVFGTIFAVIFLKELFTLKMFIGCSLILIAILMAETKLSFLHFK